MMLILGLLGMYFDAAVVFLPNSSLLFRLAVAILCHIWKSIRYNLTFDHGQKHLTVFKKYLTWSKFFESS